MHHLNNWHIFGAAVTTIACIVFLIRYDLLLWRAEDEHARELWLEAEQELNPPAFRRAKRHNPRVPSAEQVECERWAA